MPRTESGKNRVQDVLLDFQAMHGELLGMIDELLECASDDTRHDLKDDSLYAAAFKRVEAMQDMPDCQLRGHLNLLAKELAVAIAEDLGHTSGDAVRKAIQPLRDKVNFVTEEARGLMDQLKAGGSK